MTEEAKIIALVDWFFDKINTPIIENLYINNPQNWDALCASLTILNDLQRPKTEYYKLEKLNHLETIGIMQTIYIEQDCILTLKNASLEQSQKNFLENYKEIRSLRNEVFGHPSEKKSNNGFYTRHFFDIIDNRNHFLKIINWKSSGDINSSSFLLNDIVKQNSKITAKYLEEIKKNFITKIESKMKEYKIKTSELFTGANYIFEKLLTKRNDPIAIDTYDTIDNDIGKAKEALMERNLFDNYKRQFEVLVFFSTKLKLQFYKQTYIDTEFYSYAIALRKEISDFKKLLKEIDNVFSSLI